MSSWIALVQNEQMKIYTRLRTWIMLGIIAAIVILVAVMMRFVLEVPVMNAVGFMGMAMGFSVFVTIFSIVIAGDIVASEFSWGTIKLLLIRPASRGRILSAKYAAVLLFTLTQLVLMFIISYFCGLLLFGLGGQPGEGAMIGNVLSTYGLRAVEIIMATTLAFMISAVFRSSSLAIGLSIFLILTANTLVFTLAQFKYTWVKYILFANTDLSPYIEGREPLVEGMTLGFSVTMLVLYWILLYGVAWLIFTKRDVAGS